MKPYKRVDRLANLIRKELANILLLHAQELQCQGISITYIKVSNDLSYAKVFITGFEQQKIPAYLETLNDNSAFLQHLLAKSLQLRVTPKLRFFYDESVIRGKKISDLIDSAVAEDRKLHKEDKE